MSAKRFGWCSTAQANHEWRWDIASTCSADVDVRRRAPADATRPRHDRPRGESHGNKRSPRVFSVGSRARFRACDRTPTACTGARHGRSCSSPPISKMSSLSRMLLVYDGTNEATPRSHDVRRFPAHCRRRSTSSPSSTMSPPTHGRAARRARPSASGGIRPSRSSTGGRHTDGRRHRRARLSPLRTHGRCCRRPCIDDPRGPDRRRISRPHRVRSLVARASRSLRPGRARSGCRACRRHDPVDLASAASMLD